MSQRRLGHIVASVFDVERAAQAHSVPKLSTMTGDRGRHRQGTGERERGERREEEKKKREEKKRKGKKRKRNGK